MQGKQLRKLEAELWRAADQLRANSKLTASEYSMPVLGLIFLRHAFNRFKKVKVDIEKDLPTHPQRGKRALTKKDFEEKNSLFLPETAQFDYLVALPENTDIGEAIDAAMKAIEEAYDNLKGVLPKNFSIFSKDLLRELLRIFNKEVLQKAEGDLFGKIYEYFLNKFAMTGAQEGGEFFTPMSLVQTIVNVIEPDHGIVLDPACGSAGMFVQTGYFIESEGLRPAEKVTFYGQEKAEQNTRLAKMNMAVHGLEGNIQEGNTFYEDKHNLAGSADFVMANPPFNVDGVDKGKDAVKKDPRLMLDGKVALPKNDNANYLWIQYFYNYLKPTGRAGFVMASSASDAGHSERDIREKLVCTGAVDVMMAVGNNFFYTRSLPCTLWFYDRGKESLNQDLQDDRMSRITIANKQNPGYQAIHENPGSDNFRSKDTVLMLDARKIYRKVTSKVNDFSPEQLQNLICIVGLYRGENEKFATTVKNYLQKASDAAFAAVDVVEQWQQTVQRIIGNEKIKTISETLYESLNNLEGYEPVQQLQKDFIDAVKNKATTAGYGSTSSAFGGGWVGATLRKPLDKLVKILLDTVAAAQRNDGLNKLPAWKALNLKEELDTLRNLQQQLSGNVEEEEPGLLHEIEYYYKQAHWLTSRFPDGVYADVEGLCKVVTQAEIATKDWSLSPGRYVGVDAATDDGIDYEERLAEIHIELESLNEEAITLANLISENYKELVV